MTRTLGRVWRSRAAVLSAGAGVAASVLGLASFIRAVSHLVRVPYPIDLPQFYVAALMFRTAPGTSFYDPAAFAHYCQAAGIQPALPPNYPPFAPLLFYPLSFLPFGSATVTWLLLNAVLTVLFVAWAARRLPPGRKKLLAFFIWFLLLLPATTETLLLGQINAILGWLLVFAVEHARRGGRRFDRLAGLGLGIAGAIKLWPLLLTGFFLLRRRYRVALSGIATFAVLTTASILLVGPASAWRWYGGHLPEYGIALTRNPTPSNQSIWAVATRLFIGGTIRGARLTAANTYDLALPALLPARALWWLAVIGFLLAAVLVLAALTWRLPAGEHQLEERAFWAVVLGIVTVLPFSWPHYAFVLIFPLVTLLSDPSVPASHTLPLGATCLLMTLLHRLWSWLIAHPLTLSFVFLAEVTMGVALLLSTWASLARAQPTREAA